MELNNMSDEDINALVDYFELLLEIELNQESQA